MSSVGKPKPERVKEMAEAMAAMDEETRTRILANVAREDPSLAMAIEDHFFDFEKIATLLPHHLAELVTECATFRDWPIALRGVSDEFWEALASSMLARRLKALKEEVAALGPQPKSKVTDARNAVVLVARRLADEGRISLRPEEFTKR